MEYIIFDLEWNNAYNYKLNKGINEIVEIGAVRLNENLEIVDTFKQLIKPRLSRKLTSRFKNLTHITMDELKDNGIGFNEAFSDFARWATGRDVVFLSWSTSDLYTLVDNFKFFKQLSIIPFMEKYADAQQYCMQFVQEDKGKQISLANCASCFNIDIDTSNLHRALEDCYVTAYCFKKVFDRERFEECIVNCDKAFFERLVFKPYYIRTINNNLFDIYAVKLSCPECSGSVKVLRDYAVENGAFKNAGQCKECKKKFWVFVRAKKTYDDIVIYKRLVSINKKRAKKIR